jgi:hypothetical protein
MPAFFEPPCATGLALADGSPSVTSAALPERLRVDDASNDIPRKSVCQLPDLLLEEDLQVVERFLRSVTIHENSFLARNNAILSPSLECGSCMRETLLTHETIQSRRGATRGRRLMALDTTRDK